MSVPVRPVVLLTSSRAESNTRSLAEIAFPSDVADYIDANAMNIGYYAYDQSNAADDFLPLIERIIAHELWVLATPLHWCTMSALAKTFVDRLSDLLSTRKDLGERLKGKRFAVICSGTDPMLPMSFDEPFLLTCNYLGMKYCGSCYGQFEEREIASVNVRAEALAFGRIVSMIGGE